MIRLRLPLSALTIDSSIEPRTGDTVDLQAEARVVLAQNGEALLELTSVNGEMPKPASDQPAAEPDSDDGEPDGDEPADLESAARDEDARSALY